MSLCIDDLVPFYLEHYDVNEDEQDAGSIASLVVCSKVLH